MPSCGEHYRQLRTDLSRDLEKLQQTLHPSQFASRRVKRCASWEDVDAENCSTSPAYRGCLRRRGRKKPWAEASGCAVLFLDREGLVLPGHDRHYLHNHVHLLWIIPDLALGTLCAVLKMLFSEKLTS